MAKWIEWVPEMAHGVHQQLLQAAGKHAGIIWMVEPPPYGRVATTPLMMDDVQHYIDEGGIPIGWIDLEGNLHTFRLQEPFTPPNFSINIEGLGDIPYEFFGLSKQFLGEVYDELCINNIGLRKRMGNA